MKRYLTILIVVLFSITYFAQNEIDNSPFKHSFEIKLEKGLPEFMLGEFINSNSTFYYAIVQSADGSYSSTFINEIQTDGDILYWWNEKNDKTELMDIYPNEFTSELPVFNFDVSDVKPGKQIINKRKVSLYKTEKIFITQSQKEITIPIGNESTLSFFVSPVYEVAGFISQYYNNQRNMPANVTSKEFIKLNLKNYYGGLISVYSLGLNIKEEDSFIFEIRFSYVNIDMEDFGVELGFFYYYPLKKNLFPFINYQLHTANKGSGTINANFAGGGLLWGFTERLAATFSIYWANSNRFYFLPENSDISWKGLVKLGIRLNY